MNLLQNTLKIGLVSAWLVTGLQTTAGAQTVEKTYQTYCASCHGAKRLGGQGPALLPQNLKRLRKKKAIKVIADGRIATQMPGFADKLNNDQIRQLAQFIYQPPAEKPIWGAKEINASRTLAKPVNRTTPVFKADPLNLFVVVESGDHHVSILDGDSFKRLARFKSHFALHGGPKFTPDGRYVFFASRDGWITKYDLYSLKVVGDIRAGINTRNMAISSDGKYLAVANYLPHTLVILDAENLKIIKVIKVQDRWRQTSRVSAVYQARPRKSFIVALKDVAEIWEIPTNADAPRIFGGFVHSNEKGMKEGLASNSGQFGIRRIEVSEPFDDFFFDQAYRNLMGSSRDGKKAAVVNLNTGQTVAGIKLPSMPHLGSGITFTYKGRRVIATPHLREAKISIIDMSTWKIIKTIKTKGPGFFMRSHENSPYAWAGVFFGPNRDLVHIIDKKTLEIVKTLRPVPGKTAAHVEFDRSGKHAVLSIWDMDGALIVYDAKSLKEVKRIKMVRPAGKYNVYNKINFSEGPSH